MPARHTRLAPRSTHGELAAALAALREEFEVPAEFPAAARAEAAASAPEPAPLADLREIPFATLDPLGAKDLDQAFHLEARGSGWRVRYAIADLPAFVRPGAALDAEARRRGQTLYLPDGSVPLHPRELSEGRASLLPGEERPAFVWTIDLDAAGAEVAARVERARVRSRARLDYAAAQRAIDAGAAAGPLALLPELGALRIAQERSRGGASLNLPEEEIVRDGSGYRIERRFPLPVEEWNAQLSLLAGMAAGGIMLAGGIGILRTMPEPDAAALAEFRARVSALGRPWPAGLGYGDYLRGLAPGTPATAAVLQAAAALFRGADYAAFDETGGEPRLARPADPRQAAIAAPYAHVTAPLRRLVDRWGLVVCAALCAGREVPEWARESLPEVPGLMRASNQRAGRISSAALDRVEAALVRDRVGEAFDAVVIEVRGDRARVQLAEPAVTAFCPADGLAAGTPARVRVTSADVPSGAIGLALLGRSPAGGSAAGRSAAGRAAAPEGETSSR
ncbi:RNB domain-containing ribonuclease [Leucobacter allii]|uniref:RNB domain-containing ribonuclease n=1 Tax=Leucobacter allii TaxID=2932247 RepID=A0ABY4FJG1_9MICO|nr:RNB domain-containing ribonuclease [Leucobacter allii]UOQ56163.1 RNB domain-containing ribonuclease [Leucobacter allii]